MKKLTSVHLILLAIFLSASILFFQTRTSAQNSTFYRVFPFSTAGGQLGFFDQQTGKIYLYDDSLRQCVQMAQLEELGQPLISAEGKRK